MAQSVKPLIDELIVERELLDILIQLVEERYVRVDDSGGVDRFEVTGLGVAVLKKDKDE